MEAVTFQFALTDADRCPESVGDAIEVNWERNWQSGFDSGTDSGSFRYDAEWAPLVEHILEDGNTEGYELRDFARLLIAEYGCASEEINRLRISLLEYGKTAYNLEKMVIPDYKTPSEPSIVIPAALAGFEITSGGKSYDAEAVAQFLGQWRKALKSGFRPSLPDPRFVLFKDDAGSTYVASDVEGEFEIMRMDVSQLLSIYAKAQAIENPAERVPAMEAAQELAVQTDHAFGFLSRLNSPQRAENDLLNARAFQNAIAIDVWNTNIVAHLASVDDG